MEGLEKRYNIGNEVELFYTPGQLVERVHYYLKHEDEREEIAHRGYERTLRDHTMEKRLADLFDRILPNWCKNEKG
jgi:spore maturation protein CgeB